MSSNRESIWYCHECSAEMRQPLMVPDPQCTSCHGSFVEKVEGTGDDPRDFHNVRDDLDDDLRPQGGFTMGSLGDFLRGNGGESGFTLHINSSGSSGGNTRTFVLGTRPGVSRGTDRVSPLSEFIRGNDRPPSGIVPPQHAMINHLLSALAQRQSDRQTGFNPFAELLGMHLPVAGGPENGRWGDYVYNQEALDQIITQLMENSNTHRPVPATEEIIAKLPKEVLEEGSPFLDKDCAVCKDQFSLDSEDPDEHVVVTLPCKHPYHQSCILPWLKSSGTCPVCRYQLVPQPDSEGPPGSQSSAPGDQRTSQGGGVLNNLFTYLGGGGTTHPQSQSDSQSSGSRRAPPGGWSDELD